MKTFFLSTFAVFLLYMNSGIAQEINIEKLDSLFEILEIEEQAMGSISITKNGKIIYQKAIGFSSFSVSKTEAATAKTRYRIGSISKMFTATMIFQLLESKKIKLESTLDNYFPSIPNADKITISNLLNHRSGIHNFTNDEAYMDYNREFKTQDEMVAIIAEGGSDFDPDTKGAYSNANYVLLGYLIEMATDKSYAVNLEERIVSILKLKDTYVGGKIGKQEHEAHSFQFMTTWSQFSETDMSIPGGAGAVVSTPTDLALFIDALFAGKLIANKNLKQMKTMTDSYGMGMFTIPFYDKSGFLRLDYQIFLN